MPWIASWHAELEKKKYHIPYCAQSFALILVFLGTYTHVAMYSSIGGCMPHMWAHWQGKVPEVTLYNQIW